MPARVASPMALAFLGGKAERWGGGQQPEARGHARAANMWAPCPRVSTSGSGHTRRGRRGPTATRACSTMAFQYPPIFETSLYKIAGSGSTAVTFSHPKGSIRAAKSTRFI